jgi:hypothetical protein
MGTLTDDDLRHLLGEAAGTYEVPADGADEVLEAMYDEVVPLRRRRWVQLGSAAAVAVAGVVVAVAVFGGNDVDRIGQLAGAPRPAAEGRAEAPVPVSAGGNAGTAGSSDLGVAPQAGGEVPAGGAALRDDSLQATAGAAAAPGAAPAPAVPQQAAPVPAAPTADGARVVKTGAIALIVEDDQVTPTLTAVQGFASAAGGVVASATTQESGPTPSGAVTLRVPVDSFEEVVARVRGMGAEVRSATTSGQDVTAQYADLEAQLRTLKAARERFLEILSRARSIGDVLAVQQRVDDVTGKIDRIEGQRQVLAAQSDNATLEVSVTEADDPVVRAQQPDDGLSKAFSDAWTGFTTGVEGLIRLSGRGILLLLCLALGYVVLRWGWRLSRRRLV